MCTSSKSANCNRERVNSHKNVPAIPTRGLGTHNVGVRTSYISVAREKIGDETASGLEYGR